MYDFIKNSSLTHALGIDGVLCIAYDYDINYYCKALYETLNIAFPSNLNNAVKKRQAEYLAGRYTARQALDAMGIVATDIPIGINRSPVWPDGIVASITHTEKTALCAIAFSQDLVCLGIDLENILSAETANELKTTIISGDEEKLLHTIPMAFEQAFTLAFSAKESLFKALHPKIGRYFDFDTAQIIGICTETQSIKFKLTENLTTDLPKGFEVFGRFYKDHERILTCVHKKA